MSSFWQQTFKDIEVSLNAGHLWIRLNRPAKRNAYSYDMVWSLQAVFAQAQTDPQVKAVFITGNGAGFCAGGDLEAMQNKSGMFAGDSVELRDHYRHGLQFLTKQIWEFDKLVIAVVNGPAAGAGCDLACMCDLRICSEQAFFIEPFAKIGLVPGDGGSYFLPLLVGYGRAMQMFLTGEKVPAQKALDWGLVGKVVPKNELEDEANKWAEKILKSSPLALSLTKKAMKDTMSRSLSSHLELLSAFQAIAQRGQEHQDLLDSLRQ